MKNAVYNLLFLLVYPFLLPGFLLRMLRRGGYAARMGDRFALYPKDVRAQFGFNGSHAYKPSEFVWIHAVSVGEVQVAGQLMRAWRAVEPTVRFCFSTTSSTGWKMALKEVKVKGEGEGEGGDVLIYNPLDFPTFVKAALRTVRPRAIVLTESEIWPNFIRTARRFHVPIFLINARVSDRSAPRYRAARFLLGDVFASFARVFAQSGLDRDRLVAAGVPRERIDVTGSFKFDVAHRNPAKEEELKAWLVKNGATVAGEGDLPPILLGGSTWPGEDKALLDVYRKMIAAEEIGDEGVAETRGGDTRAGKTRGCRARTIGGQIPILVIAPRHFEKADEVEANIRAAGFSCIRRSKTIIAAAPPPRLGDALVADATPPRPPVFLCDTTGEMMGLFGLATWVFVGKSLCAHGSQNMIEPCLCGKPTVVGPYTENFRPVMSDLLAARAIVQVPDAAALSETILAWHRNGDDGLGIRAAEAVARRCGVVPRCVAKMREALKGPRVQGR